MKKTPAKKAEKKKPAQKKRKGKKGAVALTYNPDIKLTIQEEIFCQYLVVNAETRGNQMMSYALAYGRIEELENAPKDDAIYENDDLTDEEVFEGDEGLEPMPHGGALKRKRKPKGRGNLIQASTYDRLYSVLCKEASVLVRKPHIQRRKYELLNAMLRDDIVDGELAKVIQQDEDLAPKVRAIQEYNSLKKRTVEQVAHIHSFADIANMTDEELKKEEERLASFFQKK